MMFDLIATIFPIVWLVMFVFIIGTFITTLVKSAKQERKNDASPRLDVEARVVTKRVDVRHHNHHHNGHNHVSSSTDYYVTFEVPSGDRMELEVSGSDYGLLVEGDAGTLSFQGTRYLGFRRR